MIVLHSHSILFSRCLPSPFPQFQVIFFSTNPPAYTEKSPLLKSTPPHKRKQCKGSSENGDRRLHSTLANSVVSLRTHRFPIMQALLFSNENNTKLMLVNYGGKVPAPQRRDLLSFYQRQCTDIANYWKPRCSTMPLTYGHILLGGKRRYNSLENKNEMERKKINKGGSNPRHWLPTPPTVCGLWRILSQELVLKCSALWSAHQLMRTENWSIWNKYSQTGLAGGSK